jgi:hypothetical protein
MRTRRRKEREERQVRSSFDCRLPSPAYRLDEKTGERAILRTSTTGSQLLKPTWIGYLNSPEWKAIRSFMLAAYPASQLSGTTEGLEVHHSKWCKRGHERPRDLAVATADEHRAIHNTLEPLTMLERLIEAEEDSRWFSLLCEYRKHLAAREFGEMPSFRELVEEATEVCT